MLVTFGELAYSNIKGIDLEPDFLSPNLNSALHYLCDLRASYLTSLCLNFLICETEDNKIYFIKSLCGLVAHLYIQTTLNSTWHVAMQLRIMKLLLLIFSMI